MLKKITFTNTSTIAIYQFSLRKSCCALAADIQRPLILISSYYLVVNFHCIQYKS